MQLLLEASVTRSSAPKNIKGCKSELQFSENFPQLKCQIGAKASGTRFLRKQITIIKLERNRARNFQRNSQLQFNTNFPQSDFRAIAFQLSTKKGENICAKPTLENCNGIYQKE